MARELQTFNVVVPAGTPQAAPVHLPTVFPVRVVRRITWRLPPGCSGLVGFYVSMGKVPVMPQPPGTWIVGDGESGAWDLEDQPDSGAWEVTAYNTGSFSHQIRIDYHVDLFEPVPQLLQLIPDLALSNYSSDLGQSYG